MGESKEITLHGEIRRVRRERERDRDREREK